VLFIVFSYENKKGPTQLQKFYYMTGRKKRCDLAKLKCCSYKGGNPLSEMISKFV